MCIRDRIYHDADGEFNINSPKQLGEVLFEKLGLHAPKKTKTGYSTNVEVLERCLLYTSVTVVSSLAGNVIVNVKDARVAISEQMASRIMV